MTVKYRNIYSFAKIALFAIASVCVALGALVYCLRSALPLMPAICILLRQNDIQRNSGSRKGVHIEEFEYLQLTVRYFAGYLIRL